MSEQETARYITTVEAFSASPAAEALWAQLFPNDAEGYCYHLAFAQSGVDNFTTGYIVVRNAAAVVCLAPYFVTDYRLDTTIQGPLKRAAHWIARYFPNLLKVRLLCIGSPVTDSAKLWLTPQVEFHVDVVRELACAMERVAERAGATLSAFKDILERDVRGLDTALRATGFARMANMPVARNAINYSSLEQYLNALGKSTRKDLRRKLRRRSEVVASEHDGVPIEFEQAHALYLNCYQKSELQFERLTPSFFRHVATLLPHECRFVLYRAEGQLIGFNLLLHKDGVLFDKYLGMDYELSRKYSLYFLSWAYNIEMCIRDGFHTYQSGQAAYDTKLKLGATLEQTYLYFRHRHRPYNFLLKMAARFLAYANFDRSLA